jgi:hypothetical protein
MMLWNGVLVMVLATAFSDHVPDDDCGLWLAPSTVQGAGLGLFVGRNVTRGRELWSDAAIAMVDLHAHQTNQFFVGPFVWDDYIWNGRFFHMDTEGYDTVDVASEGTMNCLLDLVNVNVWYPRRRRQSTWRSGGDQNGPGATGSSPFHHRKVTARHDIQAGTELFVNCMYVSLVRDAQ